MFICLVWVLESETGFKNRLSKEATGGRSNQVLLRGDRTSPASAFHEERFALNTYSFLGMKWSELPDW